MSFGKKLQDLDFESSKHLWTRFSIGNYLWAVGTVIFATMANLGFEKMFGKWSASLLYLFTVAIIGARWSRGPALLAACLSALAWNFLFIPPYSTFYVHDPQDVAILFLYFALALITGHLTSALRAKERELSVLSEKEARLREEANKNYLANQSERLYTIILNSLSHELRTPLTTVLGASSSLLETKAGEDRDSRRELLIEIQESSHILNRLLGNLLDTSRFESGRINLRRQECELMEILMQAKDRLGKDRNEHSFAFRIPEQTIVFADHTFLEQVFFNLFLNACLYTPTSTLIEVTALDYDSFVKIEVIDHGSSKDLAVDKLFEKFYRGSRGRQPGTGLGLFISRAIVQAHGGSISCEINENGGLKFTISLPKGRSKRE